MLLGPPACSVAVVSPYRTLLPFGSQTSTVPRFLARIGASIFERSPATTTITLFGVSLLAATLVAGCGDDSGAAPPLQASASSSVGCKSGHGYQHPTLGYHLCFPDNWISRDYTAEPGSGGALSVGHVDQLVERTTNLESADGLDRLDL